MLKYHLKKKKKISDAQVKPDILEVGIWKIQKAKSDSSKGWIFKTHQSNMEIQMLEGQHQTFLLETPNIWNSLQKFLQKIGLKYKSNRGSNNKSKYITIKPFFLF